MFELFRRSAARFAAGPMLFIVWFHEGQVAGRLEHYALGATSKAASALFLIAPICSAACAWDAGRLRSARVLRLGPSRGTIAITVRTALPCLALGGFGLLFALAITFLGNDIVGLPDLRLLGMALAVIAAHVIIGFAVGLRLPAVVAVPVLLVGTFFWFTRPLAIEPLWIRHLNGFELGCCTVQQGATTDAILAPIILAAGLAFAAFTTVFIARNRRYLVAPAIPLVLIAAAVSASALVNDLGADPVEPRDASALICAGEAPRVCVWPEHEHRLTEVREQAEDLRAKLAELDIDVPEEATEKSHPLGTWQFRLRQDGDAAAVRASLVVGLIPQSTCETDDGAEATRHAVAARALWLWVAGATGEELPNDGRFDPLLVQYVRDVQKTPKAEQVAWFRDASASLRQCSTIPAPPGQL